MTETKAICKDDLMTCDICMEHFDEQAHQPKFLSCHHSFCETCLMKVAKQRDVIECPSCRAPTDLDASGIAGLQTNFYISFVQGLIRKLSLTEGCSKHSMQPMSFFCQKCCTTVCRDCLVLEHRETDGHNIQDMSLAVETQKDELSTGINAAQNILTGSMDRLTALRTEACNLAIAKDAVLKDIDEAFSKYVASLMERNQEIQKNLLDAYEHEAGTLFQTTSTLKKHVECLRQILAKSSLVLQHGSLQDIINAKQKLESVSKQIADRVGGFGVGKNNFAFDSEFGESKYKSSINTLGKVVQRTALPSSFKFEALDRLIASIPVKIKLSVSTCNGEKLVNLTTLNILVMDRTDTTIPSSLTYHADVESYLLTFLPQMSGEHRLVPTFHGQPIQEAMHTIQVESNNPVAVYGKLGDGKGTFRSPRALALDKSGNIYVADTGNRLIQKLDKNGEFLYQFKIDSGGEDCSTCDLALLPNEESIVCIETLVVTGAHPSTGNTVAIYTTKGRLKYKFTKKAMRCALCLAANSRSEIIVSDYLMHSLFVYKVSGEHVRTIGDAGCFNHPAFICVGADDTMFVTDTNKNSVLQFDHEGKLLHRFGKEGSSKGEMFQPFGIVSDGKNILVVDSGNRRIQVFTKDGGFVSMIESTDQPLDQPRGLGLTDDGHILVADRDNHCIKKFRFK